MSAETTAQSITIMSAKDITMPSHKDLMYVELKGADGGKTDKSRGGQGAIVKGVLKIGTGANEVSPSGTLRIIPGQAGHSSRHNSGGGGGGTALVYQPTENANWVILAVAGGGGGGTIEQSFPGVWIAPDCDGRPGSTWGDGGGGTSTYKSFVEPGDGGFGGGGALQGTQLTCGGKRGMANGVPSLADGGAGSECAASGGARFGSGGAARSLGTGGYAGSMGGGGGGYSGGDGAKNWHRGSGGSSFTNDAYFLSLKTSSYGATNSPEDGYLRYSYNVSEIRFAQDTNKCFTLGYAGQTDNGTNILTWDCNGKTSMRWYYSDQDHSIRIGKGIDKCVDLENGNTANGTNIRIWDCMNHDEQHWLYDGIHKKIRSYRNIEKCMEVETTGEYEKGQNIRIMDCNQHSRQKFNVQ